MRPGRRSHCLLSLTCLSSRYVFCVYQALGGLVCKTDTTLPSSSLWSRGNKSIHPMIARTPKYSHLSNSSRIESVFWGPG